MAIKIDINEIKKAAKDSCGYTDVTGQSLFTGRFMKHLADLECYCEKREIEAPGYEIVLVTFLAGYTQSKGYYMGLLKELVETLTGDD